MKPAPCQEEGCTADLQQEAGGTVVDASLRHMRDFHGYGEAQALRATGRVVKAQRQ